MHRLRIYILLIASSTCFFTAGAQQTSDEPILTPSDTITSIKTGESNTNPFIIRDIIITGNKKTRVSVILRELPFRPGDHFQLQQLVAKFEDARKQLMNTALFHEVLVALKSFDGYQVDVLVDVKERWYIFPVPYFKMVDRNINQWLVKNKASLDRVNYGVKLLYNNVTGYNDKLNVMLMSGYTRQISLNYDRLYIDRKMKWGMRIGFALGKNRELNYNTVNNKEVFWKDSNNFIRSFFKSNLELTYRRAIKTRHRFGIAYNEEKVADTIVALNPEYFSGGRNRIRFPELYYLMSYFDVDYIPYPLKGFEAKLLFSKKGFNPLMNVWELKVSTGNYFQILPKTYFSINASGSIKLPFKQPFFNSRLLGYGDLFMQGYEYYVVDGVAGGCLKTTLSRELVKFNIPLPVKKTKPINHIPIRIFGKIYGNSGYVHNPDPGINPLTNKMLYSGGIGLDILTLYDLNIRLEWSFNQLGQNGIYLHRKSSF